MQHSDAAEIPFVENHFDCTTIAFGIRNMPDPQKVLAEMFRVLKPGGRALILEFSMPANPVLRALHLIYLKNIIPIIGFLFSGHYKAYRYLNRTIEEFPYGAAFEAWMKGAGFKNVLSHPVTFGVANIYQGDKT